MPTYEYTCASCGEHVEAVQSFSDEPLTTCAHCSGPLRKVFGSVGIVLKGSGFYRTDSRSGSNGSRTAKKDKDKEQGGAPPTGGTESTSSASSPSSSPGSGASEKTSKQSASPASAAAN